ncbi:inactive hydroxysteroid dehydrogenase-like protein 1 [Oncorhynchus keta]|uniref:inactive hydroxysteroid dehydrogenase-like protein 1 n=1 Tax=Oncorhynchus keta TaxID=8018 RepID=UPI00227C34E8|nr:inactive hydroxysteroid dehydrogenase-like protein 1 [Oncorhynchus keta]
MVLVYVLSKVWQTDLKAYGQWAVVTGATAGIGKAYANELARRGLDIVLVSRSKDKLHIVAKEIESQHGLQTQIIQTDFTEGHDIYPAIAEALRDLDIGILGREPMAMIYRRKRTRSQKGDDNQEMRKELKLVNN